MMSGVGDSMAHGTANVASRKMAPVSRTTCNVSERTSIGRSPPHSTSIAVQWRLGLHLWSLKHGPAHTTSHTDTRRSRAHRTIPTARMRADGEPADMECSCMPPKGGDGRSGHGRARCGARTYPRSRGVRGNVRGADAGEHSEAARAGGRIQNVPV